MTTIKTNLSKVTDTMKDPKSRLIIAKAYTSSYLLKPKPTDVDTDNRTLFEPRTWIKKFTHRYPFLPSLRSTQPQAIHPLQRRSRSKARSLLNSHLAPLLTRIWINSTTPVDQRLMWHPLIEDSMTYPNTTIKTYDSIAEDVLILLPFFHQ